MSSNSVTLEIPIGLYQKLQALAADEGREPVEIIAQLVDQRLPAADPVLELIGAYRSQHPLIDDIPVSEDPDLYILAAQIGPEAYTQHAWEIAPHRYKRGRDGRPVRRAEGQA